MANGKKTKLVMSAMTRKISHHPASKHVAKKGRGGKSMAKKVMVKC
jgi:hypothetical protein